jgi:CHAT domain-containing protein/cytochrome c-type biogenesis protein CcmH/NrfG
VNQQDRHLSIEQIEHLIGTQPFATENRAQSALIQEARRHLGMCEECQRLVSMHENRNRSFLELGVDVPNEGTNNCPSEASLLELAAGVLDDKEMENLLDHASQCDHCGPILRNGVASLADQVTPEEESVLNNLRSTHGAWQQELSEKLSLQSSPSSQFGTTRIPWWRGLAIWPKLGLASGALLVIVAAWLSWNSFTANKPDRLLARAYTEKRTLEMRIPSAAYAPMSQTRGSDRSQSRMSQSTSLLEAEAAISEKLKSRPDDPHWLHAQGRADLLEGNYESAIAALEKARQFAPETADTSIDLANAYFLRGEDLNRPQDYGAAIDLLGRVLASQPNNPIARFNRAIALEQIASYQNAVSDWGEFLRLDPKSDWAPEARARLAALQEKIRQEKGRSGRSLKEPSDFIAALDSGNDDQIAEIDARVELYRQVALERWLPVAFAAESPEARIAKRACEKLATLMQSRHDDNWLTDLLNQSQVSKRSVTSAIGLLAEAARTNHTSDRDHAKKVARDAEAIFRHASVPAGELQAKFEDVYADQLVHRNEDCESGSQTLLTSESGHHYAWLRIQSLLESAVCTSTSDERALVLSETARSLAETHRYSTLQMRSLTFLASLSWSVGDSGSAWKYSAEGLNKYWTADFPYMIGYNLYTNLDYLAEEDQRWFLQSSILREAVDMILSSPDTVLRGLEQERLGEALLMTGELSEAETTFKEAQHLFAESPEGSRKLNLQAEAEIGLAKVELQRRDPKSAFARLEKIRATIDKIPDKDLSLSFYQSLGLAQMGAGREVDAEHSLGLAVHLAEEGLGLVSSERKRLEWARKNEPTYRAMVRLKFVAHPDEAFAYWQWYRAAYSRAGTKKLQLSAGSPGTYQTPPAATTLMERDTALISYAVFDEGIAIWVYDSAGLASRWVPLSERRITGLGKEFGQHCSDPGSDLQNLRREASELYQNIFLPVESLLANHKHLLIEPDGALNGVPFEALIDENGGYLGDRYSLTISFGLKYLAAARPWQALTRQSHALVVGDPASSSWSVLPAAESEARDVAAFFESPQLLLRGDATYLAIARELPDADVFHFAGHGMVSATAAGPLLAGSELLDVLKLEALDFRKANLVVLSSCGSARVNAGMFSDADNMARGLVSAEVPEVVASRWMVDSSSTALLMKDFYKHLLDGKGVSDSLRFAAASVRAQSCTVHPYYWASFAVFGRG